MTDPVALVRARILAISAVTALVATRVYSGILPQSVTAPAVAIQSPTIEETSHLRGTSGLIEATVQVHSVGRTRAEAVQVADAIAGNGAGSGLSHFRGWVGSIWVRAVFPMAVTREEYRTTPTVEYEVMRAYRVSVRRG
jgi:hypothetical protein